MQRNGQFPSTRMLTRAAWLFAAGAALALTPAPAALAQSGKPAPSKNKDSAPTDPGAELEQLRQKVKDLEEQLEKATQRNKDLTTDLDSLRKEIKRLQKEGGPVPAPSGAPTPPPAGTKPVNTKPGGPGPSTGGGEVGADPLSSPAALLQTLQRDYDKKFSAAPTGTPAEVAKVKRAVEQWVAQQPKQFHGQTDWVIRVLEAETSNVTTRPLRVKYEVLQPGTDKAIGDPCASMFPARFAKIMSDSPNQKKWKLTSQVVAKPVFDAKRENKDTRTDTSDRPLIGPYAAFDFEVQVVNLNPQN